MAIDAGLRRNNGGARPGAGRPKGSLQKAPGELRTMVATFAEHNMRGAQALYLRVAKKDPGEALRLLIAMLEFSMPKLARTEYTGEGGGPIQHDLNERAARVAAILARANPAGARLALVPGAVDAAGRAADRGTGE